MHRVSLLLFVFAGLVSAAPCPIAPLSTYLAPGHTCEIGDISTGGFQLFPGGGSPPSPDTVLATPLTGPNQVGFRFEGEFTTLGQPVPGGMMFEFTTPFNSTLYEFVSLQVTAINPAAQDPSFWLVIVTDLDTVSSQLTNVSVPTVGGGLTSSGALPTVSSSRLPLVHLNLTKVEQGAEASISGYEFLYTYRATVPEPSSLLLLCGGLAGMLWMARRRRR